MLLFKNVALHFAIVCSDIVHYKSIFMMHYFYHICKIVSIQQQIYFDIILCKFKTSNLKFSLSVCIIIHLYKFPSPYKQKHTLAFRVNMH